MTVGMGIVSKVIEKLEVKSKFRNKEVHYCDNKLGIVAKRKGTK